MFIVLSLLWKNKSINLLFKNDDDPNHCHNHKHNQ